MTLMALRGAFSVGAGLNSLYSETESDFGDQLLIYSLTRLGRSAESSDPDCARTQ